MMCHVRLRCRLAICMARSPLVSLETHVLCAVRRLTCGSLSAVGVALGHIPFGLRRLARRAAV